MIGDARQPRVHIGAAKILGAEHVMHRNLLFLMGQLDIFHGRMMEFTWPLILIGLGAWLIVRRLGDTKGGSK